MAKLSTTTSDDIITHQKSIFARHGIPQALMSDNGPQYATAAFDHFAHKYGFTHIMSSPMYPQSNGAVERAVKIVKDLLNKNEDPYLALLAYPSTLLENGYGPAELLMGCKLRTTVPIVSKQLLPRLPKFSELREKEKQLRQRQQTNFNRCHQASDLEALQTGDYVWITSTEGKVVKEANIRSYIVETPNGNYWRHH